MDLWLELGSAGVIVETLNGGMKLGDYFLKHILDLVSSRFPQRGAPSSLGRVY